MIHKLRETENVCRALILGTVTGTGAELTRGWASTVIIVVGGILTIVSGVFVLREKYSKWRMAQEQESTFRCERCKRGYHIQCPFPAGERPDDCVLRTGKKV